LRKLIIHYHIFKNAGTSIDHILKDNFRSGFFETEFAQHNAITGNVGLIEDWINENPKVKVLSSHTAHLPPPRVEGVEIFPFLLLRHPLVRLKSAYSFERKQKKATTFGVKLAQSTDFKTYIETYLAMPDNVNCRNVQACRLCKREYWLKGDLGDRALDSFNELPFVGVVEAFEETIFALETWLRPYFPKFEVFPVHQNITEKRDLANEVRLGEIAVELGRDLFEELCALNQIDIDLHQRALARLRESLKERV